jgi:hypothetical protein
MTLNNYFLTTSQRFSIGDITIFPYLLFPFVRIDLIVSSLISLKNTYWCRYQIWYSIARRSINNESVIIDLFKSAYDVKI